MATETTNYGLTKPGYSDTADVADINENMEKIDGVLNYVSDAIGIVVDGDKTAYADGVEIGQFVILRNSTITGCDDGLYKAAKTIPYNTVIDSTYLTAEPSGAANALNASLGDQLHVAVVQKYSGDGHVIIGQNDDIPQGVQLVSVFGTYPTCLNVFFTPSDQAITPNVVYTRHGNGSDATGTLTLIVLYK